MRARTSGPSRPAAVAVWIALVLSVPSGALALLGAVDVAHPGGDVGISLSRSNGPIMVAPAFLPTPGTTDGGAVPASSILQVDVLLAPRDSASLEARIALEYLPGSPEFHHFLSPSQIAASFGPTAADYARAVAYFQQNGLSVTASPDGMFLTVAGPAPDVAAAFHTSFERFHAGDRTYFSHTTPATLPPGIPWAGVLGLGNVSSLRPLVHPVATRPLTTAGCSYTPAYAPCAIEAGYNLTGFLGAGTNGTGYRIGVVDTYDGTENQTRLAADLSSFVSANGIPLGSVNYLYPVPTTRNLNATNTGWGLEESLDIEWARAIAPGATIDMTFAPDPTAGLYASVDWLVAHHAVDVLSMSWGEPDVGIYNSATMPCSSACNASSDGSYTLLHPVLAAAAAEGIGAFAASGDCGAAEGTNGVSTGYPASDPSATGVGGTVLTLTSGGGYSTESGWSGNQSGSPAPGCTNQGGSGGGYAPFPLPWYQSAPGLSTTITHRAVPDVSLNSGAGITIVYQGGGTAVDGTSAATPVWAGLEAIADQSAGGPLGLLNPSLYSIARTPADAGAFHDVTSGWNGYYAGIGWDPVTGIGSPNAAVLIPLLTAGAFGSPVPFSVLLQGSPRFGPTGTNATFSVSAGPGVGAGPLYDIDFGDGNASLAPAQTAFHVYPKSGVFVARAVVFDGQGSSVSPGLAMVIGGGSALSVNLSGPATGTVGVPVTLNATVFGGTAPYRYSYSFGDGSYWTTVGHTTTTHVYAQPGVYCPTVVVSDAATPIDGGSSTPISIAIGGATGPVCPTGSPLTANLTSSVTAADLPADFPFHVIPRGGTGSVTVQYVTDDAYVHACECGIFRTVGVHRVTAYVNDSFNEQTTASITVTTYPALSARWSATPTSGPGPLSVSFFAVVSGGHLANPANLTHWSFGDGTNGTGTAPVHVYASAGEYVAIGSTFDRGFGNASTAILIDVTGGASLAPVLSANVTPAILGAAGTAVSFRAAALSGIGPFTYYWDLGANDSAYGSWVNQSYGWSSCLAAGTCPLSVHLTVASASGATAFANFSLAPLLSVRGSALVVADTFNGAPGPTPLRVTGSAAIGGVAGATVSWAFGDGTVVPGSPVSHVYLSPGLYTIAVTGIDPYGDTFVRTHALAVSGIPRSPPTVNGTATVLGQGVAPENVTFNVTASGGAGAPYTYNWTFGDGTNGSGAVVTHSYNRSGAFNATVNASDRLGEVGTKQFALFFIAVSVVNVSLIARDASAGGQTLVWISITTHCGARITPCGPPVLLHPVYLDLLHRAIPNDPRPSNVLFPTTAGANLSMNVSMPVPSTPGDFYLNLSTVGPFYLGSGEALLHVGPAPLDWWFPTLGGPVPIAILLLSAVVGVVVAVVGMRMHRRPPIASFSPSRPPSAGAGPPVG